MLDYICVRLCDFSCVAGAEISRWCHCCASHLLQVHFIWTLKGSRDAAASPQWNHDNVHIPAEVGKQRAVSLHWRLNHLVI